MYTYTCPQCSRTDTLRVLITTPASLAQTESGGIETNDRDHPHYWDESSSMTCGSCGATGQAFSFRTPDPTATPDGRLTVEALATALRNIAAVTTDRHQDQDSMCAEIQGLCYKALHP